MNASSESIFTKEQFEYIEYIKTGASSGYILSCIGLIFFMQSGFVLVECGSIKKCHYSDVVVKNIIDSITGVLGFWMAGFGIAFGTSNSNGLFGIDGRYYCTSGFDQMTEENLWIKWLFQLAFANTSSTIVSGLLTEKCRIEVYGAISFFMSFFIYPVVAHWAWNENGWLAVRGYQDFAGSGVIHMLGGLVGIIGNIFAGSRIRKNPGKLQFPCLKNSYRLRKLQQFEEDERKHVENIQEVEELQEILAKGIIDEDDIRKLQHIVLEDYDYPSFELETSSILFTVIGTYILFIGWFFFNGGSAYTIFPAEGEPHVGKIIVNTVIGGCSAGVFCCFLKQPILNFAGCRKKIFKKRYLYDSVGLSNGLLAGLVAITAGCNVVEPYEAFIIGIIGGLVYCLFLRLLYALNIDDPIEASAVHFANGMWGLISCFIFDTKRGLFSDNDDIGSYVAVQFYAIFAIFLWGTVCSLVFYTPFFLTGWLKYHPVVEQIGVGHFKMGEMGIEFRKHLRKDNFCDQTINVDNLVQGVNFHIGNGDDDNNNIFDLQKSESIVNLSSNNSKSVKDLQSLSGGQRSNKVRIHPQPLNDSYGHDSSFRSVNQELLVNDISQREIGYSSSRPREVGDETPYAELKDSRNSEKLQVSQSANYEKGWNIAEIQEEESIADLEDSDYDGQEEERGNVSGIPVNQIIEEEQETQNRKANETSDVKVEEV